MKDNEICFNKTLAVLVLITIGIVVGVIATRSNLSSDSQAISRPKVCSYGNQILSTTSTPWKYNTSTKCITNASNVNTGYKCTSDAGGNLLGRSILDLATCPKPATVGRTVCQYGGTTLPATLGAAPYAKAYTVNKGGCITENGNLIGLRCDASTKFLGKTDNTCKTVVTQQPVETLVAVCNDPAVKGQVGRIIGDYGGPGRNACQLFNGNYFSTTRTNPNVALAPISLSEYCALDSTIRTGAVCGFAAPAVTECSFFGKSMSQWAGTYEVEANTGCIVTTANKYNNGYYCDPGTFKTTYNLGLCPR